MDTNKMREISREQFEAWHRSVVEGEPPHEKYSDGSYVNPHVNRYWTGWQASRAAVVVELPGTEWFGEYSQEAARVMRDGCAEAIEAQGLKVAS